MEHEEKKEILEHIQLIIENKLGKLDSNLQLIVQEVAFIKAQTTKTNGRVTVLEDNFYDLEKISESHYGKCPNNTIIREIQDTLLSRKSIRNWLFASIGIVSGVITLYFLIVKFLSQ